MQELSKSQETSNDTVNLTLPSQETAKSMSRVSPYLTEPGLDELTPQAVPLGITKRNQNIGHDIFEHRVTLVMTNSR